MNLCLHMLSNGVYFERLSVRLYAYANVHIHKRSLYFGLKSLFLAQLKSWADQVLEYCWVSLHLNENFVIIYPPSCCSKTFWKKFWSYVKVSKWWQNSHVWVNYGTMCLYLRRLFLTSLSLQEEEFFKKWWPLKQSKKKRKSVIVLRRA